MTHHLPACLALVPIAGDPLCLQPPGDVKSVAVQEDGVVEVALDESEIDTLSDLLEKMLKYEPEERISAAQVLSHPWFTS